jgi:hypothetical protein
MSVIRWNPHKLKFYAFDLLHLNGKDLRDRPLLERRAELKELLELDEISPLQLSEEFIGDAGAFFREALSIGLRASCRSSHLHATEVDAARHGSSANASRKAPWSSSARIETARPAQCWRYSQALIGKA